MNYPSTQAQVTEHLTDAMRLIWGDRLDTEGMADTPARVAKYWLAITDGLNQDPAAPLQKTFPCEHNELVLIKDIPFNSLCEHHLLPFYGVAHIAYLPQERVVGLSKIPRSLDILAARPQMQERITQQMADLIYRHLKPLGVLVLLEAEHGCMQTRGVLKAGSLTKTMGVRGSYWNDAIALSLGRVYSRLVSWS